MIKPIKKVPPLSFKNVTKAKTLLQCLIFDLRH